MRYNYDDIVSLEDIIGTEEEVYDPWDEIIDKIDNGEEL